jgi:hypothetical protein
MIRWHCYALNLTGGAMPDFAIVSLEDAKLHTTSGRQREYLNEYAGYIRQLSHGMAGMLRPGEDEKLATIRRRLIAAAKTLGIDLVIKRSGQDIYFWQEDGGEEQPQRKGRYTRRRRTAVDIPPPDQPVDEIGMVEQGIPSEESPEFGQTPL